ncbi:MAG: aconitate hydratase [Candidatus Zixiibacteriota bacterium]|jgi:aconitate hydratase
MGKTLTQKILDEHLVEGTPAPGEHVAVRIDQTLTQDATGTMAYLQFEAMKLPEVKTDLSVSYVDHNTLQMGYENADDHRYLQGVAEKYGLYLSRAGNGICHQVHLERFGVPGKTLLGSDSHTPTGGGIGMIAMGAGGLDVAVAMAGGPFWITYPAVVGVKLTGRLADWVSAKDVILTLLSELTTKGNVGTVVEYLGPGVATLSVPERATITNMGAELGVTTSVFPSDLVTKMFLEGQERGDAWRELAADPDAAYARVIELDLGEVEPMVAQPHSPDNVVPVRDIAGLAVDQVCIGSCTNASYKDLATVAEILEGRTIAPGTSLIVAPGSKQVLRMIADDGHLSSLVAAGARIAEAACGFCIGMGHAPTSEAVSVRTNNRNFFGRSGTASAGIYLVSPETAAVAAFHGELVDPRGAGIQYPEVPVPERFTVDDNLVRHVHDPAAEIVRGPNIGEPPANDPLPDGFTAEVGLKVGDKITTDHIMPAGPRLKFRSNVGVYSRFVFEGVDETFAERAKANADRGTFNVVVAGESYGQGSSREHAALCPMYLGVKAVIARSFERIHSANLVNFGILPLTFRDPADYDKLAPGDNLKVENLREALRPGDPLKITNERDGYSFEVEHNLSERQLAIIKAGGLLNYQSAQA